MNLLEEAIIYSTVMYQGKVRRINNTPYILHPLEVAHILSTMTDDMEIIAAGVLHDIVEDTDGTIAEIVKRFGRRVAVLVDAVTENKYENEEMSATWKRRKEECLVKLISSSDHGVKMLWLADKLSNLRSLAGSYGEMGEKMWDYLHESDPAEQLWYYKTIAEVVEMELNKTGRYKEYIDRINYLWPGTFDSSKAKYKEYRKIDVSGCTRIGKGAKGEVFRYDDELIVKVYNEKNTYKDVEREIALARTAFVMGLPTAISFGIVSVGNGYGAMFELINAKTISEFIAMNPTHFDNFAGIMADIAKQIHSTEPDDEKLFPNANKQLEGWVKRAKLDGELEAELIGRIRALPKPKYLVHGDLHTSNVFLSNGEPLFIDVDRMSVGDPILDISSMYLFYVGYAVLDPKTIENFMGFSAQTAEAFYHSFIKHYTGTDDPAVTNEIDRKAAVLAYVRLIGQIKKKNVLSDSDIASVELLTGKIKTLLE